MREQSLLRMHCTLALPLTQQHAVIPPPYLADAERLVEVAVPAVQVRGHVDVDDVAVLQLARVGDAVADDLI